MKNPIISVILSVYNSEQYVAEAIESILNQTYSNFEFIIIDDGSTDRSLGIINSYKDERIILISRENRGLIASLNEGIAKAKGKYIVRMDADDISLPERFEIQVEFMEENPNIGICGSHVLFFGNNLKPSTWKVPKGDIAIRNELLFSSPFAHPSVIINRKMIFKYNLFYNSDFLHMEDFELWTRVAKVTKMANIPKVLLKYRVLANSITREADKEINKRYLMHKKIFSAYLKELEILNTEKENRLHFNISLNRRIKENEVDFDVLAKYFDKILRANKNKDIFDTLEIKKIFGKKWLVTMYYKNQFGRVFSKYFLYGIYATIGRFK